MSAPLTTEVIQIDPREIRLLELNARFMRHEVFARLVENIQADGSLTQIPFGWQVHDDETRTPLIGDAGQPIYEVLSGNHRVKAAIAAELPLIAFQVTREYLTPDRRRAIQLSHNAIAGEDDPALLKLIYDSIGTIEMKLATGIDDKRLQLLPDVNIAAMSEANLAFQVIALVFLPDEIPQVNAVWDRLKKEIAQARGVWLTRWNEYDAALDALELASLAYGVRNTATALLIVLDIFARHLDDLADGYLDSDGAPLKPGQRVPLASVFGTLTIPVDLAAALKKTIDRGLSDGSLASDRRWEALYPLTDLVPRAPNAKKKPAQV